MIPEKIKDKCLHQFCWQYPDERRVIVINRSDGRIRVLNQYLDSILFDPKGNEIVTDKYIKVAKDNNIYPVEGTFELLPE